MEREETRETAALKFEPWDSDVISKMQDDFSAVGWVLSPSSEVGVDLRLASVILGKTKGELAEVAQKMGTGVFEMLSHMDTSIGHLSMLVEILQAAHARQAIAAAVVADGIPDAIWREGMH